MLIATTSMNMKGIATNFLPPIRSNKVLRVPHLFTSEHAELEGVPRSEGRSYGFMSGPPGTELTLQTSQAAEVVAKAIGNQFELKVVLHIHVAVLRIQKDERRGRLP